MLRQVPEFCSVISEISKVPGRRYCSVSNVKIESTGFQAQVELDAGIQELFKGFQIVHSNQYSNF